MNDDLETTLENLFQVGPSNLTRVFNDWSGISAKPQSYWTLNGLTIGTEIMGQLFSPYDNTTITSTPVDGTFGWLIPTDSDNAICVYIWIYWIKDRG